MAADLPEPLVAEEVDLRDFGFMPIDVVAERDSLIAATASGDGFRANYLLRCASWHQVPAASIPGNERQQAALAGYGRDVEGWRTIKPEALADWELCRDGRWYHPTVADKAFAAWESRHARTKELAADAARKRAKRRADREEREASGGHPADVSEASGGNPPLRGEGESEDRERESLASLDAREAELIVGNDKGNDKGKVIPFGSAAAFGRVRQIWNDRLEGKAARLLKSTPYREKQIPKLLKELADDDTYGELGADVFERFDSLCQIIAQCQFLTGGGDRGWRCDIDFVTRPGKIIEIFEGKYAGERRLTGVAATLEAMRRAVINREARGEDGAERADREAERRAAAELKMRQTAAVHYAERHIRYGAALAPDTSNWFDPSGALFDLALCKAEVQRQRSARAAAEAAE